MKFTAVLGRGAMAAALIALFAAPSAHADGGMITGGTVGQSVYKAGAGDIFVKYISKQAAYTNDLYFYLSLPGGPSQFLLRNSAMEGTIVDATTSAGLAVGAEAIFSICSNLGAASAVGSGCTTANQYFTGPASRNPDTPTPRFHAAVWTREAYLAGCVLSPTNCSANIASLLSDPQFNLVIGFEDSFNYNIDSDFNDLVFAVRNTTTTPEPVTMSLLATGLAGMGGANLFKRRKKLV